MLILSDIFYFVALILYFIIFSFHEILNLDHERRVYSIKLLIGIETLHLAKLMAMNEYPFSTEGLVEIWKLLSFKLNENLRSIGGCITARLATRLKNAIGEFMILNH